MIRSFTLCVLLVIVMISWSCYAPKFLGLVKIDENKGEGYGPSEPSIAVSPLDPSLVVGSSILNRIYYSRDSARTFGRTLITSPLGVFGDPVTWADHSGRFYFLHLGDPEHKGRSSSRWLESQVIHSSTDGGKTWDEGSSIGANPPKQQDKPWMASDPVSDDLVVTWTEFDKYGSTDKTDHSRIRFSKSIDHGKSWSSAITISEQEGDCLDDDMTPEGAVPSYGLHHEIYVTWAYNSKLWFDKSLDGGKTWLAHDQVIMDQVEGWAIDVPALGRANGMPVTCTDLSTHQYKGSIYVCWADMKSGKEDMDIWIMYSRDGGDHWSDRIRVNQDHTTRFQFLPWMSVDPVTGHIYLIYYDRRNHTDDQVDVVIAYSMNGGKTFKEMLLKETTFTPPGKEAFFGDYNNISAAHGVIRPIWTSYDNKKLSVWTALINERGHAKKRLTPSKTNLTLR